MVHFVSQELDLEGSSEATACAEPQGPKADLQRRVRKLLLHALHLWRTKRYDCSAIEHVLDFVQGKIEKFEDKVGEIEGAAAGAIWSSIKQAVNDMLPSAEEKGQCGDLPAGKAADDKATDGFMKRLDRQSGIQGICWNRSTPGWRVAWRDGGRQRLAGPVVPLTFFFLVLVSLVK